MTGAERQAAYRRRHPEKVKAARRLYVKNNPEKLREIALRSHHKDPSRKLFQLAKARAKLLDRAFGITRSDIMIPTHCPVLGIELVVGGGTGFQDASPTLDRIDNRFGYVRGNVLVVSWRANRLKADATPEEMQMLANYYNRRA